MTEQRWEPVESSQVFEDERSLEVGEMTINGKTHKTLTIWGEPNTLGYTVAPDNGYALCKLVEVDVTQPAITPDWSRAPKWAQWWAVDERRTSDKRAWYYEEKPYLGVDGWIQATNVLERDTITVIPDGYDWRNSLQQRPVTEQPAAEVLYRVEGLVTIEGSEYGDITWYSVGDKHEDSMIDEIDAILAANVGQKISITIERVQP